MRVCVVVCVCVYSYVSVCCLIYCVYVYMLSLLQSRISRLPAYLVIQYMRFFVGRAGASEEIVAKKVLKVSAHC